MQFHLFSLGGDIGLNWADLYDVPEALTARLNQFDQPAGRRRVDDMPVVSPTDALPGWDQMPDEGLLGLFASAWMQMTRMQRSLQGSIASGICSTVPLK